MTVYFDKLKALRQKAYAPYSDYKVGAILVMENGEEYVGVNVENASFGGTICAERSAFVSAISQQGYVAGNFQSIHLLAGESEDFAMPCGFCRQVMSEFVESDFSIFVYNITGANKAYSMNELLPHGFSKAQLM